MKKYSSKEYAESVMNTSNLGALTKVWWLTVGEYIDLLDRIEELEKELFLKNNAVSPIYKTSGNEYFSTAEQIEENSNDTEDDWKKQAEISMTDYNDQVDTINSVLADRHP